MPANTATCGLKVLAKGRLCWLFLPWCIAHQLELAVKDALKTTCFDLMDDNILLRLYYLYEKSPKKCRELQGIIITDPREYFSSIML